MRPHRSLLAVAAVVAASLLSALGGAAPVSAATGDWPTDHGDNRRTGHVAGTAAFTSLRTGWTTGLDGAVYGSPIVVGGLVVAATENDTVYALDPATGAVRWSRHLRTAVTDTSVLACPGNISPSGITGSPAYDRSTGRVFVVTVTSSPTTGVTHELWGLSLADGSVGTTRRVEVPGTDPRAQQQRAALAVDGGRVYVAFGGLAGDCGSYKGAVLAVPTSGTGATASYVVPTAREAGIWAPGGPVVAADGSVYVAVGNGAATSGTWDGSDSVTRLSPSMAVLDSFAPASWASDNARDLDLGSMTPALTGDGYVLQVGKSGTAYTMRAGALGGIGHPVASGTVCPTYGVAAVAASSVYLPCTGGVTRVDVGSDGSIHPRWTQAATNGSPVLGPGAAYAVSNGRLVALSRGTGAVLGSIAVPTTSRFATPALTGSLALVPTLTGVTAVRVG